MGWDGTNWRAAWSLALTSYAARISAAGQVLDARVMAPGAAVFGYDVPPGVFHSIVALESGTVFVEAKAGPYAVPLEAEWGGWAPAEGEAGVPAYLALLRNRLAG